MKQKNNIKFILLMLPVSVLAGVAAAFGMEYFLTRQQLQILGAKFGGVMPFMALVAVLTAMCVVLIAFIIRTLAQRKGRYYRE